jgi:hypothetical protein
MGATTRRAKRIDHGKCVIEMRESDHQRQINRQFSNLVAKPMLVIFGLIAVVALLSELSPSLPSQHPHPEDIPLQRLIWSVDLDRKLSGDDKKILKAGAHKILADDPGCYEINYGARSNSPSPNNPRQKPYFVTCTNKDQNDLYNVFFDAYDATSANPLKAPTPFGEQASRDLCNKAIKNHAQHPSTVSIDSFFGYSTRAYGNGNRSIWQLFTARNDYNLELTFKADCIISPDGNLDITIAEKR